MLLVRLSEDAQVICKLKDILLEVLRYVSPQGVTQCLCKVPQARMHALWQTCVESIGNWVQKCNCQYEPKVGIVQL